MSIAMFIFQREEEHLYCDTCSPKNEEEWEKKSPQEMNYLRETKDGFIHRCEICNSTVAAHKVFPCIENYPLVFER